MIFIELFHIRIKASSIGHHNPHQHIQYSWGGNKHLSTPSKEVPKTDLDFFLDNDTLSLLIIHLYQSIWIFYIGYDWLLEFWANLFHRPRSQEGWNCCTNASPLWKRGAHRSLQNLHEPPPLFRQWFKNRHKRSRAHSDPWVKFRRH